MSKPKGKKAQDKRIPADEKLLDFIIKEGIILISDEVTVLNTSVKDAVYVNVKTPRIRAFYIDEAKKLAEGENKPKVDIVH